MIAIRDGEAHMETQRNRLDGLNMDELVSLDECRSDSLEPCYPAVVALCL